MENKEFIDKNRVYRLGTRGSLLAQMQSQSVATQLESLAPGVRIELQIIKTTGDRIVDRPLHDVGGKGLFTKELEIALLNGEIDFAVHSYKDVPVTMPLVDVSTLVIAATPRREDARDVLVAGPTVHSIKQLPTGATVGTCSLRRACQLLNHRPDLNIVSVRGNIDTRLKKQRDGEFDAIVLAAAGLIRAGLFDSGLMTEITVQEMVPAAGQGALGLQCRDADQPTRRLLSLLNDSQTQTCVDLEREVIRLLNADCHSPIGVHATSVGDDVEMRIAMGQEGSSQVEKKLVNGKADQVLPRIRDVLVHRT